jgi:hypothetical protein
MRRTLWCRSPRIRRNAALAAFAVAPPGPAVAAAAAPPRTAEADPQQLERLQ